LLGRCSTIWTTHLTLLILVILGSCIYAWAGSDHNPSIYVSCVAGMTDTHHHNQLSPWDEVLRIFCAGWLWIVILPTSPPE
jgi:hypothetical protein